MKKGSTLFLRLALVAITVIVIAICIFMTPEMVREARAAGTFRNLLPLIVIMCVSALPFLFGLFQAWKLLNYIDTNTAFSEKSVTALKRIKYAATLIAVMFVGILPTFYYVAEMDDAPGLIIVGLIIVSVPIVVAVFAAVLQKLLRNAITLQSEHDLTV